MTRKANPVIVGGVVRATWTMRKDSAASNGGEIAVRWLDNTRRPQRALETEMQRLSAILGRDLRLTVQK